MTPMAMSDGHEAVPAIMTAAFSSLRLTDHQPSPVPFRARDGSTNTSHARECLHAAVDSIHCRRCRSLGTEVTQRAPKHTDCLHAAVDAVHCRRCKSRNNDGVQFPTTPPDATTPISKSTHSRSPVVPWPFARVEAGKEYSEKPVAYLRARKVRDRFQHLWDGEYDKRKQRTPSREQGDLIAERHRKENTWAQKRSDEHSLLVPFTWVCAARHAIAMRGKRSGRAWVRKLQLRGASPKEWRLRALQGRKMLRHRLFEARTGVKGFGKRLAVGYQSRSRRTGSSGRGGELVKHVDRDCWMC